MTHNETPSEARSLPDPTKDTRTARKSGRSERLEQNGAVPCPHCKSTIQHGERIGCCSGCGRVFSSTSAHDAHRRVTYCLDPLEAGLVAKNMRGTVVYGWPRGNVVWDTTQQKGEGA